MTRNLGTRIDDPVIAEFAFDQNFCRTLDMPLEGLENCDHPLTADTSRAAQQRTLLLFTSLARIGARISLMPGCRSRLDWESASGHAPAYATSCATISASRPTPNIKADLRARMKWTPQKYRPGITRLAPSRVTGKPSSSQTSPSIQP